MEKIKIGLLLRSNTRTCVVGCPPAQEFPAFGSMVSIPLDHDHCAYGLVSDIHITDDGLVRQLATSPEVSEAVIQDNRQNRNVPVEMSVLFIGFKQGSKISHMLPPRPPLSLDSIFPCTDADIRAFSAAGQLGYLRHILDAEEYPTADLLAAHLLQAGRAHQAGGDTDWFSQAVDKITTLLRDDYPRLMGILQAIADVQSDLSTEQQKSEG